MKPTVVVDYGRVLTCTTDGVSTFQVQDGFELLSSLDEPYLIVAEAPFESYNVDRRVEFLALCQAKGHDPRVISPRMTSNYRINHGVEKSDHNDALAIWALAHDGRTLRRMTELVTGVDDEVEAAKYELMVLRRTGKKDEYAREYAARLGPVPPERMASLSNTSAKKRDGYWNLTLLAAVAKAVEHTSNREEWTRLLGLYGDGYPSQFRSDLMRHVWRHKRKKGEVTFAQFQRDLRWLHWKLRQLDT